MQKFKGFTSVGFIGLIAVVVFGLGWIFASLVDTSWVFGENMLSDLGVSDTDARFYFNGACLIAGILVMIAGIGIASVKTKLYAISGVFLAFAGLFLAFVGVFTLDNEEVHDFFAVGLAVLALIGLILMTADDWKNGRVLYGGISIVMVGALLVIYVVRDLAYFEAIGAIAFMFWFSMTCVKTSRIKEKL